VLVSCAGPDDRNDPLEIVALGRGRPSLEIGVQVSATRAGTPEYPTHSWIAAYAAGRLGQCGPCGGAALHLNGRWCRAACAGTLPAEAGALWGISAGGVHAFDRLQLNFDAAADGISAGPLAAFIGSQARRVVLQAKPANMALLAGLDRLGAAFDVLFDASGGAGQRPDAWPEALPGRFNAWAGGSGRTRRRTTSPASQAWLPLAACAISGWTRSAGCAPPTAAASTRGAPPRSTRLPRHGTSSGIQGLARADSSGVDSGRR
jgi:hypothetical protein